MSELWHISASLEHIGTARNMHYSADKGSECAYPALGTTLFWFKDPCEELFTDLEKKQADKKDFVYIKREIEFLNVSQTDREANHKRWANNLAFGKTGVATG
jgi:hypothetical protein